MPFFWILIGVFIIAAVGFVLGRGRAMGSVGQDARKLHSLPGYYGYNSALLGLIPALLVLFIWSALQPVWVQGSVSNLLTVQDEGNLNLAMSEVRRVADGLDLAVAQGVMTSEAARDLQADTGDLRDQLAGIGVALGSDVTPETLVAAQAYRTKSGTWTLIKTLAVFAIALGGTAFALTQTTATFRARNTVEKIVLGVLMAAASVAILTTVGIVFSLIFNTVEFFKLYPGSDFFFGTVWQPSFSGRGGASELGLLPLLWGTLYISIVALIVAVPIGLFAAIYLSEYAGPKVRGFAKPCLEVLAGIPTIVYGLFALQIIGPMLSDVFGSGGALGVSWMGGDRSVITAGLVMGIMLIPFVSSLSDDIINAVPQAMRDGSLGLGATPSETIRQVVVPAALPGIVGAILLAASRAIGETMIVVLGAGAAGRLDLNPFEAMTTVTAKIVSQLTGDSDFSSPEALVAFALGMTLFVFTLCLNVVALMIVRKYREQYE